MQKLKWGVSAGSSKQDNFTDKVFVRFFSSSRVWMEFVATTVTRMFIQTSTPGR
jgi:hypothetical protein